MTTTRPREGAAGAPVCGVTAGIGVGVLLALLAGWGGLQAVSAGEDDREETTTAPATTTATRVTTTTTAVATPAPRGRPRTAQIGGTVDVTWLVDMEMVREEDERSTCASIAPSYEVAIADGAGDVQAVTNLVDPQTLRDSADDLTHTLECRFSYASEVPRAADYIVTISDGEGVIKTATANGIVAATSGVPLRISVSCTVDDGCSAEG